MPDICIYYSKENKQRVEWGQTYSLTLMMGSFTIKFHSFLKAQKLYHIE